MWAYFGGPGFYEQIAVDTNGCQGVVAQYSITDNPQNTTTIIQQGDSLYLNPAPPVWQYQWYNNGTLIEGATMSYITPGDNGDYTVNIIDNNGCDFTTAPYNYIKGNLANITSSVVTIFPNPATDKVFVSLKNTNSTLTLMAVNGQTVYRKKAFTGVTELDMKGLESGLYLLQVVDANGLHTYKIIKE